MSFPLTPLDGGELLPYECHPGNTAISLSLGAERAEDKALAADLAKGIKRQRRGVQECGAGVGGGAGGRVHAGRATGGCRTRRRSRWTRRRRGHRRRHREQK